MQNQPTTNLFFLAVLFLFTACQPASDSNDGWLELFNGKDFTGWRASENTATFSVTEEGYIMAVGPRSHLFYEGEHLGDGFKNFEMELDIMTHRLANSGVYFYTQYQEEGWPGTGREVQVNNTHPGEGDFKELKKTGSLYGVRNLHKAMAQDSVWFHLRFIVQNKQVRIWVNDINTVNYTQPVNPLENGLSERDTISSGTVAIQGHDPLSKILYKNIRIRRLPDDSTEGQPIEYHFGDWYLKMRKFQGNQYPFIDLNASIASSADFDKLLQFYYDSGVNIGLTAPADSVSAWKAKYEKIPIFLGEKVEPGATPTGMAEYQIGEAAMPESSDGDAQQFMTAYVAEIMSLLESSNVNIWAKATQLPEAFADQYDQLWTPEVLTPILELAAEKGIAIEIDNQAKTPSYDVIKLAKEKGCVFSYAGISSNVMNNNSQYFLEVIDSCQITYKDLYVPLWE